MYVVYESVQTESVTITAAGSEIDETSLKEGGKCGIEKARAEQTRKRIVRFSNS